MFIENKYTKWYFSIISCAKNGFRNKKDGKYESHHIVPKSFGGSNRKENLVLLTCKEHFICHLLLVRMLDDKRNKMKMVKAIVRMSGCGKYKLTSRTYQNIGILHSESMSGENNPRYGKPGTMLGKTHTSETKEMMSAAKAGKNNSFYGKKHNESSKETIGTKNSKSIICLNTGTVYKSQSEAAHRLNLRQSDIANCLGGRQSSTKGFRFSFADAA